MASVLLLVNRHSRLGRSAHLDGVVQRLEGLGLTVIREATASKHEVGTMIRRHRGHIDLLVLGGGDGTISAAAPWLVETGLPFAILPLGTGNDLARTLGIESLEQACTIAATGRPHAIDIGEVNGQYFFNVASIGMSVAVKHNLTRELKQRWGPLAYAVSAARALNQIRPFTADIRADQRHFRVQSIQVAVGNGRHYGGGMTIDAAATIDDHLLHLYSLAPGGLIYLARLVPALRTGRIKGRPGVRVACGRDIAVLTDRPMPVNTDGDVTTWTPARFRVRPRAVTVLVPESYGRRWDDVGAAQ